MIKLEDINNTVMNIIGYFMLGATFDRTKPLYENNLDELDNVEIGMRIEDEFHIHLSDDEIMLLYSLTLDQITNLIFLKINKK